MPERFADDDSKAKIGKEPIKKQEAAPRTDSNAFTGQKASDPNAGRYSPPQLNVKLDLSEEKFRKYIAPYIQPLKEGATQKEITETLSKLYNLIKLADYGGALGIEYRDSAGKAPKTPDQVFTPEKDGKLRMNCEESAELFFSAAKKPNAPVEEIAFLDIKLQTKGRLDSLETEQLHMAVMYVGSQFYLFDATHGMSGPLDNLDFAGINKFYAGKEFTRGTTITTIIGITEEPKILTGEGGAYAVHYMELGGHYNNSKQYELAYAAYMKAYESEPVKEDRQRIVKVCLNAGGVAYDEQRYAEAEFYFRKALEHTPTNRDAKQNLVMAFAMQKNSEALKLSDEFIKTDATFYKVKALAAIEIKDKNAELEAMREWVNTAKSAEAFEEATLSLLRHRKLDEVIDLCNQWSATYPAAQKPYWGKAHALFLVGEKKGNTPAALPDFERVVDVCKAGLEPEIKKDSATSRDLNDLMEKARRNVNAIKRSQ